MSPRLYSIKETIHEDDYLYEVVESGGQLGVRCRKYVLGKDLYGDFFDKYSLCEEYKIRKLIEKRYPIITQKFETIAWCWPYDHFDLSTGKEIAKKRVDTKIELKKRKIKSFIRKIEKHNLPKMFKEELSKNLLLKCQKCFYGGQNKFPECLDFDPIKDCLYFDVMNDNDPRDEDYDCLSYINIDNMTN